MKFRENLDIKKVPERELVKEVYKLSKINWGVDDGFYPLGSCTMKYNPRINEKIASFLEFAFCHPVFPEIYQGALAIMYELQELLCKITGMDAFCLHPAAGAHGELLSLMITKKYFLDKKDFGRRYVLIPDSAHGTNPASAAMCKFGVKEVKSDSRGNVDLKDLRSKIGEDVAVFMLTYPNTLGLADENIKEVVKMCKDYGILLYLDGANFNAIAGIVRPGDMGFDFVHLNLHKTFSTPHGGGGPGAGPIGVKKELEKYLPYPSVKMIESDKGERKYYLDYSNQVSSVGKIEAFFGNFPIILRAWAYIKMLGEEGLRKNSQIAVLNANYLMKKLSERYHVPYNRICKHEFVLSEKGLGVRVEDLAKAIQDEGFHPPTIYFPLIVKGAIMIEPTETETKETLDKFAKSMLNLFELSNKNPEYFEKLPRKQAVGRVDIVRANREIVVSDRKR